MGLVDALFDLDSGDSVLFGSTFVAKPLARSGGMRRADVEIYRKVLTDIAAFSSSGYLQVSVEMIRLNSPTIYSTSRFNRRFFWSVEALFHEKGSCSRQQAVEKIRETSPCELYHFLQAFLQSGPQMFLQLYILLRDNTFRNYDTVTVQIVSIVFSFLTMASTIATYQRFESQKIVGRCYPWSPEEQVKARRRNLLRMTSTAESLLVRNSEAVTPQSNPVTPSIMKNFYSRYGEGPSNQQWDQNDLSANITDDDKLTASDTVDSQSPTVSFKQELIENIDEIQEYVRRTDDYKLTTGEQEDPVIEEVFDQSPRTPAPPTPTAYLFKRASMLKNMFVFDAQSFIKDHVPRLPEGMFEQDEKKTADETDGDALSLPSRKQMISGLEEDDLVGKAISFAGWIMFLLMRVISFSVFYVFFPTFFWMVCLNHYLLMIACIIYEVRFHEKLERYFFYLFLAYIYLYSLLEFKIRFIHVRTWYVGYFVIVFAENIVMSALWYNLGVFESWWFDFLHFVTITSGVLSLLCLSFYYAFLRPKDKLLYVN